MNGHVQDILTEGKLVFINGLWDTKGALQSYIFQYYILMIWKLIVGSEKKSCKLKRELLVYLQFQ